MVQKFMVLIIIADHLLKLNLHLLKLGLIFEWESIFVMLVFPEIFIYIYKSCFCLEKSVARISICSFLLNS